MHTRNKYTADDDSNKTGNEVVKSSGLSIAARMNLLSILLPANLEYLKGNFSLNIAPIKPHIHLLLNFISSLNCWRQFVSTMIPSLRKVVCYIQ